jgi:hypothetical protein
MKKSNNKKRLNISKITFLDIKKVITIRQTVEDEPFEEWFNSPTEYEKEDVACLDKLIKKHRNLLSGYLEEELKMKFISTILNRVDFTFDSVKDWYERPIKTMINGWQIGGITDFLVAKGEKEPETPFFFIQEFKPITGSTPDDQVLAQMLVALELNELRLIRGGFIMGQFWKFVILEKKDDNSFHFYTSSSFDSLKIDQLTLVYKHLKTIKEKYCH